jgi:hypothetical protein
MRHLQVVDTWSPPLERNCHAYFSGTRLKFFMHHWISRLVDVEYAVIVAIDTREVCKLAISMKD